MVETRDDSAEAERRLARYAAIGIPAATVGAAAVVGFTMNLGPAILVLTAGTLLGTIALLWASLRTLSGDAPLPLELEAMAIRSRKVDTLGEQKRRVLRALKDLELEHSVGKIDDKDYASLGDRFRGEAKTLMREMDEQIDPMRDEAERLANKHLAKKGLLPAEQGSAATQGADAAAESAKVATVATVAATDATPAEDAELATAEATDATPAPASAGRTSDDPLLEVTKIEARKASGRPAARARIDCPKCSVSNEPDAQFCKKCGTAIQLVTCAQCRATNEPDAEFCKKCGRSMKAAEKKSDD